MRLVKSAGTPSVGKSGANSSTIFSYSNDSMLNALEYSSMTVNSGVYIGSRFYVPAPLEFSKVSIYAYTQSALSAIQQTLFFANVAEPPVAFAESETLSYSGTLVGKKLTFEFASKITLAPGYYYAGLRTLTTSATGQTVYYARYPGATSGNGAPQDNLVLGRYGFDANWPTLNVTGSSARPLVMFFS